MTENELREYFHSHRPSLSDDTTYLAGLSAKMDKMAEVKRMSEAVHKQNRMNFAIVFCLGILVGSAIIAFIILKPISAPQFRIGVISSAIAFIAEWKQVFIFLIAALAIGISIFSVKRSYR